MSRIGGVNLEWIVRNRDDSDSLTHYGVKGMKWGVRKDDDKGSKDKTTNRKSDNGNRKDKAVRIDEGVAKVDVFDWRQFKGEQAINELISIKIPDRYASKDNAQKALDNLPRFNTRLGEEQQRQATNHDRATYMRNINCFECTMAYEMRRRGYNVQAKEMNGGWASEALHAFDVKDAFIIKLSPDRSSSGNKTELAKAAYKQLEEQCLSYGNGARGSVGITYFDFDGGHSMAWEVKDGKFKIIDSQGASSSGYEAFLHADVVDSDVRVYRLDNADILPGVTDFVEPFEATDEEKDKAKPKALNMAEARAKKEADEKRNKNRKEREDAQRKAMKEMETNRSTVEKLIRKVKTVTNDLIAKGKRFLKNPLNIQTKKAIVTRGSSITWEVR